jgi:hypothetical protein
VSDQCYAASEMQRIEGYCISVSQSFVEENNKLEKIANLV